MILLFTNAFFFHLNQLKWFDTLNWINYTFDIYGYKCSLQ